MKTIEIDDELYQYIAGQTQHIGESASSILRRLLPIDLISTCDPLKSRDDDFSILVSLVNNATFIDEKKLVNRFLSILSALYLCDKTLFSTATTSLHGSKRQYLAKDEQTLLQTGNNTKPKQIVDTPYFVVTNSNTERKVFIIESLMKSMSVPEQIIHLVKNKFVEK